MLVLLIMFIITIPVANHKVGIDLPVGPPPTGESTVHRLDIEAGGALFWDGVPVAVAALPARLAAVREAGPAAVLHLSTDGGTRYEVFDRVLATVKRAGVERLGLPGNHAYAAAVF